MISFVYLDVGGVVELDFSNTNKWEELRDDLGVTPEKQAAYQTIWDRCWPTVCTTYDVEMLVPVFKRELGLQLPDDYSLLGDFVRRFESNPSIWPVVNEMKALVPVGLLTNMYIGMFAAIQKASLLPKVVWDVVIDSTVVGYQKPEARIFEIAEAKADVPSKNILFVDNSAEHIEVAKSLGWQTFLYDSSQPAKSSRDLLQFFQKHRLA